jgi:hypothetical protein
MTGKGHDHHTLPRLFSQRVKRRRSRYKEGRKEERRKKKGKKNEERRKKEGKKDKTV